MAADHTFPQSGDEDDAENFAQLMGHETTTGYVGSGMGFNPDYTVPEVVVTTGVCYILQSSDTASSTGETRLRTGSVVQVDQETISLTDNDVNHIYVEPDLGTNDNGSYTSYTNESNASSNALKVGEIDTSGDTSTEYNRAPSATFRETFTVEASGGGNIFEADSTSIDALFTLNVDDDIVSLSNGTIWDESAGEITPSVLPSDVALTGDLLDVSEDGSAVESDVTEVDLQNALDATVNSGVVEIDVDESSISHDNIADVSPDDHHPEIDVANDGTTQVTGPEEIDFDGVLDAAQTASGARISLDMDGVAGSFLDVSGGDIDVQIGDGLVNDGFGNITLNLGDGLEFDGTQVRLDEDESNSWTSNQVFAGGVEMLSDLDFSHREAVSMVLENVAGNPSTRITGQIWYDTTED